VVAVSFWTFEGLKCFYQRVFVCVNLSVREQSSSQLCEEPEHENRLFFFPFSKVEKEKSVRLWWWRRTWLNMVNFVCLSDERERETKLSRRHRFSSRKDFFFLSSYSSSWSPQFCVVLTVIFSRQENLIPKLSRQDKGTQSKCQCRNKWVTARR
jgi:hypothetical protein